MVRFTVCPEGCRWSEVDAANAETAYSNICCRYGTKTRIAIINQADGSTAIFIRELDKAGNLVKIIRH